MSQHQHLHDDLKGIIRGELLFDDLSRMLYSTDASLFEVLPVGVVVPRDEEDLQALVRYAGEHQVALIPRGAGTGLAGESLGPGVVVDLSKYFGRIVEIGADTVRVQPGVVLRALKEALAQRGRRLAPDPAHLECTLGGMLATDASGPRAAQHGTMRDHVCELRLMLDTGDVVTASRRSRWPTMSDEQSRWQDIIAGTVTLLEQVEQASVEGPRLRLNRCGYRLQGVLGTRELDLPRLLVGSEGTLGLITEATIRTIPLAGGRSVVLLGFARLDPALRAARKAVEGGLTACELLDRRLLRLARGDTHLAELVPDGVEAVLLVEYEGESQGEARERGRALIESLYREQRLAIFARQAEDEAECEQFWQLCMAPLPGLLGLRGGAKPVVLVEDIAVPPEQLPTFIPRVQDILRKQETTAAYLIHAATGQVHLRPFLNVHDPLEKARLWTLADEIYGLVLQMNGTISAQHGTGLARLPWVGRQLGSLAGVHRELKAIFDPRWLFNPGKIVSLPDQAPTWPLRRFPAGGTLLPLLNWGGSSPVIESVACNGCGECRVQSSSRRMCPTFRPTLDEAATPRAKANLMRRLLDGEDVSRLSSDAVRAVADLCINCKMCAQECPSRVQIPRLMMEAKAANVAHHGLDRSDWVLARTENFAGLGSALAGVVNAVLAHPVSRWLLEKVFGISRKRRLPRFAWRSFMNLAHRRGWTRKPRSARPRVAYFVDIFANYNDPLIAEAVVAVLHHNGIEVYVPPTQVGCGMAPLAYGDLDTAREAVQRNLRILADLAREGFPILCSEPTAALMLRQDSLHLVDDSDAQLVAAQTVEFTAYLWDLHQQGLLRTDFKSLDLALGHHVPCHIKALGREPAGPSLLSLIPGVRVNTIDVSCSGMAGTFGFKAANYDLSLAAGKPMLDELARPRHLFGSTECSACRLQMEDGTGKRTLHPAQYLALAYGLMPELVDRLKEPIGMWVLQ